MSSYGAESLIPIPSIQPYTPSPTWNVQKPVEPKPPLKVDYTTKKLTIKKITPKVETVPVENVPAEYQPGAKPSLFTNKNVLIAGGAGVVLVALLLAVKYGTKRGVK